MPTSSAHDRPTAHHPRCFIALSPDRPTRQRLANLACPLPATARLHPADLHLTIAFLGNLDAGHEARLRETLRPLARRLPDLDLASLELWPAPSRPRVAVAAYALPDPLRALYDATRTVLIDMALPVESRPFRPHVTLARFKHDQRAPAELPPPSGEPPARFDGLGLYCTAPPGSPARYAALFRFDLA